MPLNPGYLLSRAGGLIMSRSVFLLPSLVNNVDGSQGDTTRRFSAMAYQQSSETQPYGDLFRAIQAHGRAKGGFKVYFTGLSGIVISTQPQSTAINSFNLSGKTLTITVDGVAQPTITFPTGTVSGVNWTAATAANAADHISKNLTGAQCIEYLDGEINRLLIRSDSYGLTSSVMVTGGTAASDLGFGNTASTVASAATLTLPNSANRVFPVSGNTTINQISSAAWVGTTTDPRPVITLQFSGTPTLTHKAVTGSTSAGTSGPLLLTDNVNYPAGANVSITFKYQKDASTESDGVARYYWVEIGRSVGLDGNIDLGNGIMGRQVAWMIGHQAPNDLNSSNQHQHVSIETIDSRGNMQTRLGIMYGLDKAIIQISSSQFLIHGNELILSGDDSQTKDMWFAIRNSGQEKDRRASIRMAKVTDGSNLQFNVHDDAGNASRVFELDRTTASLDMAGSFQLKRSGTNIASASTVTLDTTKGNIFPITGASTINYITTTGWQSGAEIDLAFTSTPTLTHNTGSVPANTAALLLRNGVNWAVDSGANIKLRYNGTNWIEVARTSYVGARSSSLQLLGSSGVTSYNWSSFPVAETIVDTAVHAPVDLTGASQFRLTILLGATTPTLAMKFRLYHVANGSMTSGTTLTNYTLLGATGSEITLVNGTGGIYVGPWEIIQESAKGTGRSVVFTGRDGNGTAAQNFKGIWFEYR